MPRRSPQETRNNLLRAASFLFREKGIRATTIQEICDRAGMTKGAFFHHFSNKRDAALATLAWYTNRLISRLEVTEGSGRDRLFNLVSRVTDNHQVAHSPGCLIATHALELAVIDDDFRAECRVQLARLRAFVQSYVSVALDEVGRDDVDAGGLAECFITTLEGGLILGRATGDRSAFDRAMASYQNYVTLVLDCGSAACT